MFVSDFSSLSLWNVFITCTLHNHLHNNNNNQTPHGAYHHPRSRCQSRACARQYGAQQRPPSGAAKQSQSQQSARIRQPAGSADRSEQHFWQSGGPAAAASVEQSARLSQPDARRRRRNYNERRKRRTVKQQCRRLSAYISADTAVTADAAVSVRRAAAATVQSTAAAAALRIWQSTATAQQLRTVLCDDDARAEPMESVPLQQAGRQEVNECQRPDW